LNSGPQGAREGSGNGKKAYSAKAQVEARSGASCAFCSFVLALYPTLDGMTERDGNTFREHLKKSHGLRQEIEP
jgi:hypothetical protein